MQKSNLKSITLLSIIFIFCFGSIIAQPQPPDRPDGRKAKEKILQIKKMKLMEILNLDEASADKFIVKYTAIERKLEAKKRELDKELDDLHELLKKGKNDADISSRTNKVIQLQNELANEAIESIKSVKPLLNDFEYAKYVVFEAKFREEFQKILFKRLKDKEGKRDRDEED